MADSDVIRKLQVYRSLFQVNRAFALLTYNLDQLSITQVFKDDIPDEQNPSGWLGQLAEIRWRSTAASPKTSTTWSMATSNACTASWKCHLQSGPCILTKKCLGHKSGTSLAKQRSSNRKHGGRDLLIPKRLGLFGAEMPIFIKMTAKTSEFAARVTVL